MMRPSGALAVVLTVTAGLGAAASVVRPDSGRTARVAAERTLPVGAVQLACPAPLVGGAAASVMTAVSTARTSASSTGRLRLAPLSGRSAQASSEARRSGTLLVSQARPGAAGLVASATGALAPDTAAGEFARSTSGLEPSHGGGSVRGIGLAACPAAETSAWFVGGGAGVGRSVELELTNSGQGGADVDIEVWGPSGQLGSDALRDVVVPPQAQRTVRLDALVPAARYVIHVVARSGRIAPALRVAEAQGVQPLGWDWVPESSAPARRLLVPGVLGGPGQRTLRLAAPGNLGAVVSVSVVGPDGSTQPDRLAAIPVPAGDVVDVDLAGALGTGDAVALDLRATAPVTAGVLAREGATPGQGTAPGELAWTASTPVLRARDSAVLPVVPAGGPGRTADLVLSAPAGSARVRLTPLVGSGRRSDGVRTVDVSAAHTVRVPLAAGTDPYALLLEPLPGSSPLVAAEVLGEAAKDGPMLTTLPLRPTVAEVTVPRVAEASGMPLVR